MSVTVIIHIMNEEPIKAELDELPAIGTQMIIINNPRRIDGKELHFLQEDVNKIILPLHRINFIQILPSGFVEEVIGFVRE